MQRYLSSLRVGALAAAAFFGAMGTLGAAELPKSPEVAETGKLAIANTLEYAPFEFIDENGKQVGINIELAEETARLLGAELDVTRMPFPSMVPGLAAGRFKVAWETFAATDDRLKQVDFVMFIKSGIVASTTADKAAQFQGENNLCGKRVGVIGGAVSDFIADRLSAECKEKGLPEIAKSIFPEGKDIIQAALSDRVDARLDDATASGYFEVTSKGQMVVVPGLYDVAPLGIAVPKGDKETAEMLRAALQELIQNGTYKTIMAKYGMTSAMIEEAYVVDAADKIRQ
ncbi:amino acid ABC transporter substrate-binding protein (PAAT family) [Pseudaminobacter salicylatoxidans]|uniref:Amino acid ABC transporter substrate-binding protein (PAAT family) n=1 Tax=Pseudaminobacter salicylatoxidans TaxID=93369 RepID=A0A316C165_PSESE|nr:ABC transporter substrate-binding protein [Pseudaminobacter salicylatoxidans]PWJ82276.1 amino acid ABC transporter substrate-binding protein (PAAT family) [Pseudaminobacter salicylatoxidans]